jgi:DNA adenine methylase
VKPPFTYFGGKTSIAPQIVRMLPAHEHYVEPFAGSLAVLLAKPQSLMETSGRSCATAPRTWNASAR